MSKLRSLAPSVVKKIFWNWKHKTTLIDPALCPRGLVDYLCKLEHNSRLLDLGCGAGNLRAALRLRGWGGHFAGVDVSRKVIEDAAVNAQDINSEWHTEAIESFPTFNEPFDTICFCESIYYVKIGSIPYLLDRCLQSLSPGGRIVVRICDADRHREYVALLKEFAFKSNPPIYVLDS
jgi:cyclopropane fatty-acyl-phospholipid synthase-like methyltransferase